MKHKKLFFKLLLGFFLSIFMFTESNAQWIQTSGPYGKTVNFLATSGNNIFAGTSSEGVFLSTDNGSNWTAANAGLTDNNINSLAINGNNIFAGIYGGGVFLSTDSDSNWTAVNTGLTDNYIFAFAISGNYIFAGTYGDGVWKRSLSEITNVEEIKSNIPSTLTLAQNYLNPFNPSTTIKWQIPKASLVTIKIYDVHGREIETVVDKYQEAGQHSILYIVNSTMSSGVYFYQLKAGNYVETKNMILLK